MRPNPFLGFQRSPSTYLPRFFFNLDAYTTGRCKEATGRENPVVASGRRTTGRDLWNYRKRIHGLATGERTTSREQSDLSRTATNKSWASVGEEI
ncbi:hypothetical protein Acr_00g0053400 [Actinidia rufa]|uniref:Uncharacterized protein n=1 Tax=Actinidia rufa TaxID=165716 RepID=A0A7J0DLG9_9ERIC|nr:hypothetical protein Acr_00g0053400 [Actinidia rufa]